MNTDLKSYIRNVSDFPKPGINFKDISPLLSSPIAFSHAVKQVKKEWAGKIDTIVGLDARGFIIGSALAFAMKVPFVMMRKAGKLPGKTFSLSYELEYGKAELEVEADAIPHGSRVLVVDDLLATGGTAVAACALIEQVGATVAGCAFVIELSFLNGRKKLSGKTIQSLIIYEE